MPSAGLVLASSSPFRRELLARLGVAFQILHPEVDESPLPGEAPEALALRLSEAKARAVADAFPDALVIGSDQVASVGGRTYGKPGTHDKAVAQLRALSGKTVHFHTGLCLLDTRATPAISYLRCVPTLVTFRELTEARIEAYLEREPAYHCAGSAKSEGLGIALIARLEGSDPNALVGLPLIALCDLFLEAGFDPLAH
ncbi:MAG: Maf family nucleotide pyrophosphatase [Zoogloeaceae bacterium]|nr:Maf family nucleotide pyrophosphatase [Zoogloeaceae bacterium]